MEELTKQVNQVKIASEDGMQDIALSSLSDLEKGINVLGETCSNCHKKGCARCTLAMAINKTITSLGREPENGYPQGSGTRIGHPGGTGLCPLPRHSSPRL